MVLWLSSGGSSEIAYGSVERLPLMFQDDFGNTCDNILSTRMANIKVDVMAKEKRLTLNKDKTVCLVMGTNKQIEEVRRQLELKSLMCGDFETRLVDSDKWLGTGSTPGAWEMPAMSLYNRERVR